VSQSITRINVNPVPRLLVAGLAVSAALALAACNRGSTDGDEAAAEPPATEEKAATPAEEQAEPAAKAPEPAPVAEEKAATPAEEQAEPAAKAPSVAAPKPPTQKAAPAPAEKTEKKLSEGKKGVPELGTSSGKKGGSRAAAGDAIEKKRVSRDRVLGKD
jgi:outer membrane biosynthesis protein TonB